MDTGFLDVRHRGEESLLETYRILLFQHGEK